MSVDTLATVTAATRRDIGAKRVPSTIRSVDLRFALQPRKEAMKYAAVLALALLAGCSAIQGRVAADSEEILAQAGFQREPLHEPGLPARRLVEQAGTYKFADPDFCGCVYAGGAAQYAELQKLRAARAAEREWILGRGSVQGSPPDRTAWSAWKPEGLEPLHATIVTTDTSERPALH
jgi:hypothetical protein